MVGLARVPSAKPVQYVKICSLYGVGFYYIPGTDTCIKVGGFVRSEFQGNTPGGSFPQYNAVNFSNRTNNDTHWRTRGAITVDARSQTQYGTLRAYTIVAPTVTDSSVGTGVPDFHHRAFIQLAGFTTGLTQSFFDFDVIAWYSNQTNRLGSSTGGTGIPLLAYTAQLGNGLSATISAESHQGRRAAVWNSGTAHATNSQGGWSTPDLVGNIRLSQSWGSAQVMGAIHEVRGSYYTPAVASSGAPSDKWGHAFGAGIRINLPQIGKGDFLAAQYTYGNGAVGYPWIGVAGTAGGNPIGAFNIQDGSGGAGDPVTVAFGPAYDAVYSAAPGSSLQMTKAWSVTGGFQHNWNPQWKTSIYGAYGAFDYNATASALILAGGAAPTIAPAAAPVAPTTGDADWSYYQIGSRTVWTPVQNLDLSVEAMYNKVNTAFDGSTNYEDKSWWSWIVRAQRNFYP